MAKILQLKEFAVNRLHVDFRHGAQDETLGTPEANRLHFDYDIFFNTEEDGLMALDLTVRLEAPEQDHEAGYSMESRLFGVFDTTGLSPESLAFLIRVNGAMILYGLLRGQLAAATGAFPGGILLLPSVDMREVVETVEARKASEAGKGKKARPKRKSEAKAPRKKPATAKAKPSAKKPRTAKKK